MRPHEIAIADQADAVFGAKVDHITAALRAGIAEVGQQQAQADFIAWLTVQGYTPASLATIAVMAISRLVTFTEAGGPDA